MASETGSGGALGKRRRVSDARLVQGLEEKTFAVREKRTLDRIENVRTKLLEYPDLLDAVEALLETGSVKGFLKGDKPIAPCVRTVGR